MGGGGGGGGRGGWLMLVTCVTYAVLEVCRVGLAMRVLLAR